MKYLDSVVLMSDKYFESDGIRKGAKGTILEPELYWDCFLVEFHDVPDGKWPMISVHASELEVISESDITDEEILNALPNNNPKCWCKYEGGNIYNLLGEKK